MSTPAVKDWGGIYFKERNSRSMCSCLCVTHDSINAFVQRRSNYKLRSTWLVVTTSQLSCKLPTYIHMSHCHRLISLTVRLKWNAMYLRSVDCPLKLTVTHWRCTLRDQGLEDVKVLWRIVPSSPRELLKWSSQAQKVASCIALCYRWLWSKYVWISEGISL